MVPSNFLASPNGLTFNKGVFFTGSVVRLTGGGHNEARSGQGIFGAQAHMLSATGGFTFVAQESVPLTSITVATGTGAPHTATIDWGDGMNSDGTILTTGNGQFSVLGSHTYVEDDQPESDASDSYTITVTLSNSTSVQVTDTAIVSEEPGEVLTAQGGFTFSTIESVPLTNITVATGTGTVNKAIIDWGDTTTSMGTIISNGSGGFSVQGSHVYLELPGQGDLENEQDAGDVYTITVTLSNSTTVSVMDTANVAEEPEEISGPPSITSLSPGSVPEGNSSFLLTLTGSGFVSGATVQWTQNGSTTSLTPFFVSNNQLQVIVPASLLTEESSAIHGAPSITVVETSNGGTVSSNAAAFTITEAPLFATGGIQFSGTLGQSVAGTVATFVDSGGPQNTSDPGDYNATIDWGDATTSSGMISLAGTVFTVTGSHNYSGAGTFTISVTIVHESAPPVTATDTATVSGGPAVGGNGIVIVTLTPSAGLLRITGYNDDVVITIQQSSPGVLEVAGIGTLVNQSSEPADFPLSSISEIDVTLLNGNDTVKMNNFSLSGNLSFYAGSGSDSIFLSSIGANLISLSVAGPGPDTVSLENATAGAVTITAGDNARISLSGVTSAGMVMLTAGKNASVSVSTLTAMGDLDISVGDNAQAVRVDDSSSYNLNILQAGTMGSPLFELENDSINHALDFNAGDGNNTIVMSAVDVVSELLLRLGAGQNSLSADHVTALLGILDGGPSGKNIYIDGGGNSGLFVSDFVGHP